MPCFQPLVTDVWKWDVCCSSPFGVFERIRSIFTKSRWDVLMPGTSVVVLLPRLTAQRSIEDAEEVERERRQKARESLRRQNSGSTPEDSSPESEAPEEKNTWAHTTKLTVFFILQLIHVIRDGRVWLPFWYIINQTADFSSKQMVISINQTDVTVTSLDRSCIIKPLEHNSRSREVTLTPAHSLKN